MNKDVDTNGGGPEPPADPLGLDGEAGTPGPPPRRGGRFLAGLALLLALGSAGAAGYLYYELIHVSEERGLAERVEDLQAELERTTRRQSARHDELAEALQASRQGQDSRVQEMQTVVQDIVARAAAAQAASEAAVRDALAELPDQAPRVPNTWRYAEAGYLLRIANHRLRMERDVAGAIALLRAADAVLAELDDFALHDVRARLTEEIAELEALPAMDIQGLFLRLEALQRNLDELPTRAPQYPAPQDESEDARRDAEQGLWNALADQLSRLLRVRRLDTPVRPLLAPQESAYLALNLRLMLERAQIAALRGEQAIFQASLDSAEDWIRRYLNADDTQVPHMLGELAALRGYELRRSLPDISGSLKALQHALQDVDAGIEPDHGLEDAPDEGSP